MSERKMKVINISNWTQELHNPRYIEFIPGQVIEVDYGLGEQLIRQPEFEEVQSAPIDNRINPPEVGKKEKKAKKGKE